MVRTIGRALAFGAATALAVMTLAPITAIPGLAKIQMWEALGVGALVAIAVALSG